MRFRRGLVALGAFAFVVSACSSGSSSTPQLPTSRARPAILYWAARKYGADATIGAVRCPQERVPKRRGFRFVCTVDIDRVPLHLVVTETDRHGRMEWVQSEALIVTKKAEEAVAIYADQHGRPTRKVSCGSTSVLTRIPGQKIACEVTSADGTKGVAVLGVQDLHSNVALLSLTP
jgi:hypothetical protein